MNNNAKSSSNRYRLIWITGSALLLITAAAILLWWNLRGSPAQNSEATQPNTQTSEVIHRDNRNIEIITRDTSATAPLALTSTSETTHVHLHQKEGQELQINLDLAGIADIRIYRDSGDLLASRRVFNNEELTLPPPDREALYTFTVTPVNIAQGGSSFTVQPTRVSPDGAVIESSPVRFASPSCLQLALFAHMAFFPFDFTRDDGPQGQDFNPFHYLPFYEWVMAPAESVTSVTRESVTLIESVTNTYGFNFEDEMSGWRLANTHTDHSTGFSVTTYTSTDNRRTVLAIRGTDGDIYNALVYQQGSWWCNFTSIAGYRHSHINSLVGFLNMPETINLLQDTRVYITGHSLGGYLAYIATHELAEMGLAGNLRRVVAFSAPIFTAETIGLIAGLDPALRSRISHFYVPEDLIAGFVGIEMPYDFPGHTSFSLVSQLFETMSDVRGVDIPQRVQAVSDVLSLVEILFPIPIPPHVAELVWRLNGAFGEEALGLSREFYDLIWHEPVAHTWHSPRPEPEDDGAGMDALRDWLTDVVLDMVDRIFDADTHFMMNFYYHLGAQGQ